MDPIGTAASAIAFAGCATNFFRVAKGIYDGRSELESEWQALERYTVQLRQYASLLPATTPGTSDLDLQGLVSDCNEIASKLLEKLENLKWRKRSLASSIKQTVVQLWTKEEINEMLVRLNNYTTRFNAILSAHTSINIEDVLERVKFMESEVGSIQENTDRIDMTTRDTNDVAHDLQREFNALRLDLQRGSQENQIKLTQQSILKSLETGVTDQRYMDISDASDVTYEWIFEEDLSNVPRPEPESLFDEKSLIPISKPKRPRCGLRSWLLSGQGIFHIVGKPGSGKSTLMKFLCDNDKTHQELQAWAGSDNELVVSQFFFWRHGHIHQRKLNGLRRSLLASVLSQTPGEIPFVFPDLWQRVNSTHFCGASGADDNVRITDRQIRMAFERMMQRAGALHDTGHRYCFFIDGLDESEEDDYWDLVESMWKWVNDSCGAVKMCVSSRELPVFLEHLSSAQSIRLQDLTSSDIASLVRHSLNKDAYFHRLEKDRPEEVGKFIRTLVHNSEGVFLWIRFVLQTVRKALASRAPWSKIRQLVDQTPTEIEQHFKNLQSSIRQEDRVEAYSVFALLRLEGRVDRFGTFSLLSYAFLADIIEDIDFAKDYPMKDSPDYSELGLLLEDASIRLHGSCAGLVELRGRPYHSTKNIWPHVLDKLPLLSKHLTLTHRTVPDFLDKALGLEKDTSYLVDSQIVQLAIHLLIVRIKAIPFPEIASVHIIPSLDGECEFASPSHLVKFIRGLVEEIEVLLLMIQLLEPPEQEKCYPELAWVDEVLCARQGLAAGSFGINWAKYCPMDKYSDGEHSKGRLPVLSLLHTAVAHGPAGYVWWTIDQHPEWLKQLPNKLELYDTVVRNMFLQINLPNRFPGFTVAEGLFDRGLLKPDLYPWTNSPCSRINFPSIFISAIWDILGFKPPGSEDTTTTYLEDSKAPEWEIIEILLRNGRADPLLYLQTIPPPLSEDRSQYLVFYYQHEIAHLEDFKPPDINHVFGGSGGLPRWYSIRTSHFSPWLATRPDLRCSLRELFEFFQPQNVHRLLELVDGMVQRLEQ